VSIGIYGVIAYTVERQTQEIGLRIALGAQRQGILQRVIGEALVLAGIGERWLAQLEAWPSAAQCRACYTGSDRTIRLHLALFPRLSPLWRSWLVTFPHAGQPKSIPC
jgi:hypothetical protein